MFKVDPQVLVHVYNFKFLVTNAPLFIQSKMAPIPENNYVRLVQIYNQIETLGSVKQNIQLSLKTKDNKTTSSANNKIRRSIKSGANWMTCLPLSMMSFVSSLINNNKKNW